MIEYTSQPPSPQAPTEPPYRFGRPPTLARAAAGGVVADPARDMDYRDRVRGVDDAYHMMRGMHFLQHSLSTSTPE